MLDFGNRIKSGKRTAESDDLFDSAENVEENSSVSSDELSAEAGVEADTAEDCAVSKTLSSRRSRRKQDDVELDKLESARILEEARSRMGISPEAVEEITKIRAIYITALEQGKFEELPQTVYTLAYLRRLCELYGLSDAEEELVTAPWSDIQCETPDSYSGTVYSDETGENRRIIRRLEVMIFSVIAILVLGLIVFGVILLVSLFRGNDEDTNSAFNEAEIVQIQGRETLKVKESLPQDRRRR